MASPVFVPPELSEGESYHVFCSYSSTDQQWTHDLINQLKDRGLRVCDQRDFTVGRPVLENMSESIQHSQKVLLLLSAEFLRSRWCLREANMSLFRDCLQRTVLVRLQSDVPIPLHLSHLPYLDAQNPDFIQQLLRAVCAPNQELPYQSPSLYNGRSLEPLPAVNQEQINRFDCGVWSDAVPDQLRPILQQETSNQRYRQAISIINTVAQTKVRFRPLWTKALALLVAGIVVFSYLLGISLFLQLPFWVNAPQGLQTVTTIFLYLMTIAILSKMNSLRKNEIQRIVRELQKAVGQANTLLLEEKVLMGADSNFKLLLVYVSVDGCRQELSALSQDPEHFHKAMLEYSSAYTCCLAKKFFPFQPVSRTRHLEDMMCFCQYVIYQLSQEQTEAQVVHDSDDLQFPTSP